VTFTFAQPLSKNARNKERRARIAEEKSKTRTASVQLKRDGRIRELSSYLRILHLPSWPIAARRVDRPGHRSKRSRVEPLTVSEASGQATASLRVRNLGAGRCGTSIEVSFSA
jgi:hypothetical protein